MDILTKLFPELVNLHRSAEETGPCTGRSLLVADGFSRETAYFFREINISKVTAPIGMPRRTALHSTQGHPLPRFYIPRLAQNTAQPPAATARDSSTVTRMKPMWTGSGPVAGSAPGTGAKSG